MSEEPLRLNGVTAPRLAQLLATLNLAAVARQIGRPRDFVFRLRRGQPLRDPSVIPALARIMNLSIATMTAIVVEDARLAKLKRKRPKL